MKAEVEAASKLDRQLLLHLYRTLLLTRAVEDRVISLYRQGRIVGGVYNEYGMEAISVGVGAAMGPEDVIAPSHRDLGAILQRGITPREIMSQWLGKLTSPTRARDGNVHIGKLEAGVLAFVSHMGASTPQAVGAALAFKLRGERRVAVASFGDGAANTGYIHESMNLAAVRRLPVVFVCNNNQFAYSTPLHKQLAIRDIADRSAAYGFPGQVVDGNDVVAVYLAAREAIERAREGGGPSLIECKTMRMHGHSEADRAEYVPKELLEEWKGKDPILRMAGRLREAGHLDDKVQAELDAEVRAVVDDAVDHAEQAPAPQGPELLDDVYATPL